MPIRVQSPRKEDQTGEEGKPSASSTRSKSGHWGEGENGARAGEAEGPAAKELDGAPALTDEVHR